jgi:hypothetical protein
MENNSGTLTAHLEATGQSLGKTLAFADALAAGRLTRSQCDESNGQQGGPNETHRKAP